MYCEDHLIHNEYFNGEWGDELIYARVGSPPVVIVVVGTSILSSVEKCNCAKASLRLQMYLQGLAGGELLEEGRELIEGRGVAHQGPHIDHAIRQPGER